MYIWHTLERFIELVAIWYVSCLSLTAVCNIEKDYLSFGSTAMVGQSHCASWIVKHFGIQSYSHITRHPLLVLTRLIIFGIFRRIVLACYLLCWHNLTYSYCVQDLSRSPIAFFAFSAFSLYHPGWNNFGCWNIHSACSFIWVVTPAVYLGFSLHWCFSLFACQHQWLPWLTVSFHSTRWHPFSLDECYSRITWLLFFWKLRWHLLHITSLSAK